MFEIINIEPINEESEKLREGYARFWNVIITRKGKVEHIFSYPTREKAEENIRQSIEHYAKQGMSLKKIKKQYSLHCGAVQLKNIKIF